MIITDEALFGYRELLDWYSSIDTKLSKKFTLEFYKVLDEIAENPTHHFFIAPNLRRCVFKTFQCAVFYKIWENYTEITLVKDLRSKPNNY